MPEAVANLLINLTDSALGLAHSHSRYSVVSPDFVRNKRRQAYSSM